MKDIGLDRRRFHELSAAALGGLVAGTIAGCGPANKGVPGPAPKGPTATNAKGELHLCRGLNDCQGQGTSGKNDCRGQGDCATVVHHTCAGENECKGLGGCGPNPAQNDCKGQGGCKVPLMESAWNKVRERKESAWTEQKQEFGAPPEKMEEES